MLEKILQQKINLGDTLVDAIVGAVKKLLADEDFIKAAVAALRAAGVRIPEQVETDSATQANEQAPAEQEPAADEKTQDEQGSDSCSGESSAVKETAPKLNWCYGGFNGSKAVISEDAVLSDATLKGDTLTFHWAKGDCRNLGATSKTDSGHTLACLFLASGKGGKFEWISTSRATRSMKNIREGYNKWPKTALDDGGRLWFCICGNDGKRRTACVEVKR